MSADPSSMDVRLSLPLYFVGPSPGEIMTSNVEGRVVVPMYLSKELAELYIEQTSDTRLRPIAIETFAEFTEAAQHVKPFAQYLCLNPVICPKAFVFLSWDEALAGLSDMEA